MCSLFCSFFFSSVCVPLFSFLIHVCFVNINMFLCFYPYWAAYMSLRTRLTQSPPNPPPPPPPPPPLPSSIPENSICATSLTHSQSPLSSLPIVAAMFSPLSFSLSLSLCLSVSVSVSVSLSLSLSLSLKKVRSVSVNKPFLFVCGWIFSDRTEFGPCVLALNTE